MRIISGKYRGKVIIAPANLPVRPTTDYAKTGLFNILNNYIDYENISVLDLFSGTGNIGYEFISRGCTNITVVDQDKNCIRFITGMFERLGADKTNIIRSDVFNFIENCFSAFDIIFADPPFEFPESEKLTTKIFENNLVKPGGMFILEHSSVKNTGTFPFFKESRKYGHVSFSFFIKPDEIK